MESAVRRFACTQCGRCCNRSPEVELSEAASIADVFVFRLMFRLYWLPQQLRDYVALQQCNGNASVTFYEKKRLLRTFAARHYAIRLRRDGRVIDYTKYLMISALALDTSPGACGALMENRCSIYDRRPLSCRTVPFHYSRAEALAESELDTFVGTAGYRCDTTESAPEVLNSGRIVDSQISTARSEAVAVARDDRTWREAIARRMSGDASLPSMRELEANSQIGAMTTSMRVACRIAAHAGLMTSEECDRLIELQLGVIKREMLERRCSQDAEQTLAEMQAEYRHDLYGHDAFAASS